MITWKPDTGIQVFISGFCISCVRQAFRFNFIAKQAQFIQLDDSKIEFQMTEAKAQVLPTVLCCMPVFRC